MSENSLLLTAARKKYRFPSAAGLLVFEQLWDLPLQAKNSLSLDAIAQTLDREIQAAGRTSFVDKGGNPAKVELENKLALVVFVIDTLQAENAAARDRRAKQVEKQTLLEALHDKKKAEILNLSAEELEARIKALEA